jgi:predicted glycoside hydrolase/deacetylase ChbG (UPF0249 family)
MLELAREYDCAIRFPFTGDISRELRDTHQQVPGLIKDFSPRRPDHFIVEFYDDGATQEKLLDLINNLQEGTSEIMCHPGYVDDAFANKSVYNRQRERELKILTAASVRDAIQASKVELITFAEL